ncbi:MAG TPA: ferritin-like fold-containing protein [Micromonosporaceae bacterium]
MSDTTAAGAGSAPAGPDPDATPVRHVEAVIDLLGMLAHGELQAFDRMAADARLAPDVARRAVLSEMAGYEIANYQRIAARLDALGADPAQAMAPFRAALQDYHEQTQPSDWLEAVTKAYVGDSIADDFFREVAQFLGPDDRALVLDVLHDARYANFAAEEIRAALAADPSVRNRLSMWARRLVGEAITQAQRVAADRSTFVALISHGSADLSGVAALLGRLTSAHTARMEAVGLNN